jgi:hypothetical protein
MTRATALAEWLAAWDCMVHGLDDFISHALAHTWLHLDASGDQLARDYKNATILISMVSHVEQGSVVLL